MKTKLLVLVLIAGMTLTALPIVSATNGVSQGQADCGTIFEMCCNAAAMDPLNYPADVVLCLAWWVITTII